MGAAEALLLLKGLLDLIPLAAKQVSIFRERGEYTDAEWNAVKADVKSWNSDPDFKKEPDPTS